MNEFLQNTFLGNSVKSWLIALGIILVSIVALRLLQTILVNRLHKFASRTKTSIDDLIIAILKSSVMPLLYILTIHFGLQYLVLSSSWHSIAHVAIMVVSTFFILKIFSQVLTYVFEKAVSRNDKDPHRKKQSKGILLIIQVILWLLGILFLIDNLGYDITTIVAGLGIGGIAIALAAQTILGDLFSYLVIFFDKPFETGDFIIMDDKMGTVEYIGIKTTRIRTLGGEQLICSNTDLPNSRVHNYKRMQERRVVFGFGVTYDTTSEKLKNIPSIVKSIINSIDSTRLDRIHFKSFGNFRLDFEVVYYVLSSDYNVYMDIQQAINLQIFDSFSREGIEFAFPTQTLFVNKDPKQED